MYKYKTAKKLWNENGLGFSAFSLAAIHRMYYLSLHGAESHLSVLLCLSPRSSVSVWSWSWVLPIYHLEHGWKLLSFLSVCSVLISQTKWCCVVIGVNVQFPPKKFYHQLAGLSGWSLGHGSVFLQTINQRDWLLVQFKSTLEPTSYSNTATFMAFQKYLYDTKYFTKSLHSVREYFVATFLCWLTKITV